MRNIFQIRPAEDGEWQALDMLEQQVLAHGSRKEVFMAVDHIAQERGNTEVMVFGTDGKLVEVREHGVLNFNSSLSGQAGPESEQRHGVEDI